MEKLQEYLSDWESQLYKVIEKALSELASKLAQMEQTAERKAKKGSNNEIIKYTDIVQAIEEIMDIDPSFDIKKKAVKMIRNQRYFLSESDIVNRICEHKKCTWNENQRKVVKKHIQKARKNEAICPGEKQCIIF